MLYYCNGKDNFYIHADVPAGFLHAVLQHFSFCTKPFSAVVGCCLPWPKPDIQLIYVICAELSGNTSRVLISGYLVCQKPFRSLCLCDNVNI